MQSRKRDEFADDSLGREARYVIRGIEQLFVGLGGEALECRCGITGRNIK